MTISTDAIIFYGYVWDEETSAPWTIDGDVDEEFDNPNDANDWQARYTAKTGLDADDCPCKVDTHCSGDYPMPYVCIKDSYVCNARGDYTELKQEQFEVEEQWDDQLKKFCRTMGIPIPAGGPKWYLVSYWSGG